MIEYEIDSRQWADLMTTIDRLNMRNMAEPAFKAIAMDIEGKAGKYPPAGLANSPSNPRGWWYERGYGIRFASGASYQTSERLGDKWYHTVYPDSLKIGNLASYAGYVHGDDDTQAVFHKARGWKQLLQTAEDALPELLRKIEAQITRIWEERRNA